MTTPRVIRVEVARARRIPGYVAVVWAGTLAPVRVYQAFFAPQRETVEADARQYVAGLCGQGVEDGPGEWQNR